MNNELTPIEQREVEFYGDALIAVRADDGQIYVSVRHLAEALGMSRQSQVRRIDRQPILADGHFKGAMMTPKGNRPANYLRVDLVPLFLTGIDTGRVNEEIRPKLERFQREAAKVLWEAFQEGRLTADPIFDELLQQDTPEVQAYKMLQGMMQLARNQIMMRSQLDSHENRLEAIEAQLSAPDHTVTQSQAMQISQAIKTVAIAQGKQSGRNEFGSVYGELYRKFEVTSYKMLPAAKFEDVMSWLTEWHQTLSDDTPF